MVTNDDDDDPSTQDLEDLACTHLSSSDELPPPTQLTIHAFSDTQASDTFRVLSNIASLPIGILWMVATLITLFMKMWQQP